MTLLEEVKELDRLLERDEYKPWCYQRLTVGKIIKLLESEQLQQAGVVRPEVESAKEGELLPAEGLAQAEQGWPDDWYGKHFYILNDDASIYQAGSFPERSSHGGGL